MWKNVRCTNSSIRRERRGSRTEQVNILGGGQTGDILLAALVGCMIAKSINRTFSQKAAESILMIC